MKIKIYHIILTFLLCIFTSNLFSQVNENKKEVEKAFSLLEEVKQADKFINRLDSAYTVDFPIGIVARGSKEMEKYALIISEMKLKGGQTYLTAYMAFTVPGTTKKIAFKGTDIPFSFDGGIYSDAKLELVSDFSIPINSNIEMRMKGEGATSVTCDCFGFKEMTISADVLFDSTLFVPENPDGTIREGEALRTNIQTTITDWDDLMLGLSLEPFQIRGMNGLGFAISNAVWDLSDKKNPANIQFGANYLSDYFMDGNPGIWQGLYIQDAQVRLPAQFRKKNASELKADSAMVAADSTYRTSDSIMDSRMSFYANNLLIDELGFTGRLAATDLMNLREGDMNGWDFSVKNLLIDIQANQLIAGQFSGQIRVPDFEINEVFDYQAVIGLNGTYAFTAGITEAIPLPVWAANLRIDKNSQLTIAVKDEKFRPSLYLNGELTINAPTDKEDTTSTKLALARIPFQGMKIQTENPKFSVEEISYGTDKNWFSRFPVTIHKIGIKNDSNRIGLQLGMGVNFTKPGDGGFGGEGDFTVWAKQSDKWRYDGVQVDRINVEIAKDSNFMLRGQVMFIRGDEIFGNGFRGDLDVVFGKFGMQATALFGNVNDYRYWFADAKLIAASGIKAGPVSLHSFSGGAYYHVKPTTEGNFNSLEIGRSRSGISYLPDNTYGLQLKAGVDFALSGSPKTMNGDAQFEMSFTPSGGFNKISFSGNAYFMPKSFDISESKLIQRTKTIMAATGDSPQLPVEEENTGLHGSIYMLYDYPNRTFHANFDIYANLAGGIIKGIGPGNKAGWGVIHFSPDDWYMHLGRPDNPNGIEVLKIAKMTNYFMVGKSIPELPPPPIEVVNILQSSGKEYEGLGEESSLGDGSGVAFGAGFGFNTGERTFLMFYGQFGCGLGFDVLLKKYEGVTCENTGRDIGINNWYAQGQAWGYISADVGIKIDLPFYSGKYSIFNMNTAAILEMKAPNPFWMRGIVHGDYHILGGKINGQCDFEFEIGEKCQMVSASPFGGMSVIGDIKPVDKENDVNVFTTPQVVFNMPVNEPITFEDENKTSKTYRIKLNHFKVSDESGNQLDGNYSWNDRNDVLVFQSHEILPGQSNLIAEASVGFEELKNGHWYAVRQGGKTSEESKQITFSTGEEPPYVPQSNVQYSYPAYRAFNYYQKENSPKFVKLKSGQRKLFNPGAEWVQKARLQAVNGGTANYISYNYDEATKKINFGIPQDLTNNTVYKLEVVNVPVNQTSSLDDNVEAESNTQTVEAEGHTADVEVITQNAEENRAAFQEKVIYTTSFRTSNYNTYTQKMNSLSYGEGVRIELYARVHRLSASIQGEAFDRYEAGDTLNNGLIRVYPILDETPWYTTNIQPLINSLDNTSLSLAGASKFEPPNSAVYLQVINNKRWLTESELSTGTISAINGYTTIKNYTPKYASEYIRKLQNDVSNKYLYDPVPTEGLKKLLLYRFVPLKPGNYPVSLQYWPPEKQNPTSTKKRVVNFEF